MYNKHEWKCVSSKKNKLKEKQTDKQKTMKKNGTVDGKNKKFHQAQHTV